MPRTQRSHIYVNSTVHQLKISLREIRPAIWRRLLVPSDIRLSDLHKVFQMTMPWLGYHMHQFIAYGENYGTPGPEDSDFGIEVRDERKFTLSKIAPESKCKFVYEYDFGDDWLHDVRVEKILPADLTMNYPICIDGERCSPPEDCGGPWGYSDLLKTLSDPKNPEYKEMKVWAESLLGHRFDPEYFDLDRINRSLHKYAKTAKAKWTKAKSSNSKTASLR